MTTKIITEADKSVRKCLEQKRSFALIAGAGAGKTSSLVDALSEVREIHGSELLRNGQRVACITFTKRAVAVIEKRLGFDELFEISTLHSFLWGEISPYERDIKAAVIEHVLPSHIAKAQSDDNGGNSQKAKRAREKVERLTVELDETKVVEKWRYDDSNFSSFSEGLLGHDDVIEVAAFLLRERKLFRRILGARYPFIFVDEAQDTFVPIVDGLNELGKDDGFPVVGYFGDPWQQIYDKRASEFAPPEGGETITKTENFRCSPQVVALLNAFRPDVQQTASGNAAELEGSVEFWLVEAEEPLGERKTYTVEQTEKVLVRLDDVEAKIGWDSPSEVMRLFLVRQMIARRLGFEELNSLFNGPYASQTAQDDFQSGEHFLLTPFLKTLIPLVRAVRDEKSRNIIEILQDRSPAFSSDSDLSSKSLSVVIKQAEESIQQLSNAWATGTTKEILNQSRKLGLVSVSERLATHLGREPRSEAFDKDVHEQDKSDWLADEFFQMSVNQLETYFDFVADNTPFSTQHGVKGEEYKDVMVVFDDTEAKWNNYNFSKVLAPATFGDPTPGQLDRSRKLAYVSFSRAEQNLRVVWFSTKPQSARDELVARGIVSTDQVKIIGL